MSRILTAPEGATQTRRPLRDAPRPRRSRLHLRHTGVAWTFLSPFLLVFVLFTAIPAIAVLFFSTTDITIGDVRHPFGVDEVGFANFVTILTNPGFVRSMLNTAIYVVIGVPVTMAISFLLALLLDSGIRRGRGFFRGVIYLPVIANVVAAGVIWKYAFTLEGPLNSFLSTLGIVGPNWFGTPSTAVTTVLLLTIWRNIGTCMVLYLAGLQGVPEEIHEAAALDGAGFWRRVWNMTLPLLRPTTLLVSVLMSVSFLNIFDEPFLVTGGGPVGSTESVAQWVYEQFGFGNVSGSMAGSVVLLVAVLIIAVIQLRVLRTKE